MKVYAHRGYSGKYPENTMLAFRKAVEAGTDGVETDVQLSRDGEVVIIHDETLDRTTNGAGFVKDHTLAELKKLDATGTFPGRFDRQEIPTFREFCDWLKETDIVANIELKNSVIYYPELEKKCVDIIRAAGVERKIIFSSFNHATLFRLKELAPDIPVGALVENAGLEYAGFYCKQFGFRYYHPDFDLLSAEAVRECKEHGVGVNVWTVNDLRAFETLVEWDVDGVITNFPRVPHDWLNK
jgi:glycerophosphoryl diester phosphodiesterase